MPDIASDMNGTSHDASETPKAPRYLKVRSSKAFILLTVCVAIFTDAFVYGVVVPVIPFSLRDRSGVSEDDGTDFVLRRG